jgi:hypothetical protein
VPCNPPTTAYIRAAAAAYLQTLAARGFLPNPAAADVCGVEEWGREAGDQNMNASSS